MTIYRDQLEAVYRLIEDPKRWTTHVTARDASGNNVAATSDEAVCFCVIGAFERCNIANNWEPVTRVLMGDEIADRYLHSELPGGIAEFNDTHSHAEVLDLLRKAIERAPVRPC